MFLCHLYTSLMFMKVFGPCSKHVVCFFADFQKIFGHYESCFFIRDLFCKFFPPACGLSSNSLDNVLYRAGVFSFNDVQLINDFFHGLGLWASPCSRSFRFSLCYPLEFYIFTFYIYEYDPFRVNFCDVCKICVYINFFSHIFWYPVVLAPFVVETTLLHCITLSLLSRVN